MDSTLTTVTEIEELLDFSSTHEGGSEGILFNHLESFLLEGERREDGEGRVVRKKHL